MHLSFSTLCKHSFTSYVFFLFSFFCMRRGMWEHTHTNMYIHTCTLEQKNSLEIAANGMYHSWLLLIHPNEPDAWSMKCTSHHGNITHQTAIWPRGDVTVSSCQYCLCPNDNINNEMLHTMSHEIRCLWNEELRGYKFRTDMTDVCVLLASRVYVANSLTTPCVAVIHACICRDKKSCTHTHKCTAGDTDLVCPPCVSEDLMRQHSRSFRSQWMWIMRMIAHSAKCLCEYQKGVWVCAGAFASSLGPCTCGFRQHQPSLFYTHTHTQTHLYWEYIRLSSVTKISHWCLCCVEWHASEEDEFASNASH